MTTAATIQAAITHQRARTTSLPRAANIARTLPKPLRRRWSRTGLLLRPTIDSDDRDSLRCPATAGGGPDERTDMLSASSALRMRRTSRARSYHAHTAVLRHRRDRAPGHRLAAASV